MEKVYKNLIAATDEHELLNTTEAERNQAYNRVAASLNLVAEALKLCENARERGEGTGVLDRVESLLYNALNG